MPNPLAVATTETPLDGKGRRLPRDVHGIDAEGIVRLADGTICCDCSRPVVARVDRSRRRYSITSAVGSRARKQRHENLSVNVAISRGNGASGIE